MASGRGVVRPCPQADFDAAEDALEGETGPFTDRTDLGWRPGEQAQQHLVLGHQQRAEKRDLVAGQARQFPPDPLPKVFGGRAGQAGQEALGDLPLRLWTTRRALATARIRPAAALTRC
jgi:hypothetical protein